MFIQLNHNATSFDHLMKAATLPFDHKLAALASFARQAGATFFCVNIRQTEETPPTFVSFHFDAIIPLTAQGIFPSLFHKGDKTECQRHGEMSRFRQDKMSHFLHVKRLQPGWLPRSSLAVLLLHRDTEHPRLALGLEPVALALDVDRCRVV